LLSQNFVMFDRQLSTSSRSVNFFIVLFELVGRRRIGQTSNIDIYYDVPNITTTLVQFGHFDR
jgi:hypothetical protein